MPKKLLIPALPERFDAGKPLRFPENREKRKTPGALKAPGVR